MKDLPAFKKLSKRSKRYYLSTWMSYIKQYNISNEKRPSEKDICEFLKAKLDAGIESSTVRVAYSHLTFACLQLYNEELPKFSYLMNLMK